MTRQEQLTYCEFCKNRGFDKVHGQVCALNNSVPILTDACSDYNPDTTEKRREKDRKSYIKENKVPITFGLVFAVLLLLLKIIRLLMKD